MRTIRQIIKKVTAGHVHSSEESHLITKTSTKYKSLWTGLYRCPEFRTSKNIFLSARQYDIRRIPQPPDHLSKVFCATVNNLNAPKSAGQVSDPVSSLGQGSGFVHRFIQNNANYHPVQTIGQIIKRSFVGQERSSDSGHLLNEISADPPSVRKGLYLSPYLRARKNLSFSTWGLWPCGYL